MNKSTKEQFRILLRALFVGFLASVVMAWPVKWLWNWLCPEIFGLPEVSALQAWGLMLMIHLIFPRTKSDPKN